MQVKAHVKNYIKYFQNASIHNKLMFTTWLAAIVPLFIIFMAVLYVFYNTTIENTKKQSQIVLDKTVDELDNYFWQALESINAIVTDINVQNAIENYVEGNYKKRLDLRDFMRNRLSNISSIGGANKNTSFYIKETDTTFSKDFADINLREVYEDTAWFNELLENKKFLYKGQGVSISDKKPVIILASNIISVKDGQVQGIVYMEFDAIFIKKLFDELVKNDKSQLICKEYMLISSVKNEMHKYISLEAYSSGIDANIEYRLSYEALKNSYQYGITLLIIGMILIIFLVYRIDKMISGWLVKRIVRLRDAMQQVARGNLDVVVEDEYTDEIGELVINLNEMTRDMKHLINREFLAKIEGQQATLKALQSQINPHFIYNTLESISMMALIKDNYEVVDMAQAFSLMMRYSMQNDTLVTIEEEIENIRNFIIIHNIRFPNHFEITYFVEGRCMDKMIPRLSIQPLVENIFKHGFESVSQKGKIIIRIFERKGKIFISVFNDGVAISKERIERIRMLINPLNQEDTIDCFALRNVSRRLKLMFGEESKLSIISRKGWGTIVTMRIPVQE